MREDLTSTPSSIPFQKKSLSEVSTFGIGGECALFVEVRTLSLLREVFQFIQKNDLPFYILGKGSNTVFDDLGFRGVVIYNKMDRLTIRGSEVYVEGGYSFSLLGSRLSQKGLSGLEFAAGSPGSVGGAIFMNAGAGGCETKDMLVSVDYMTFSGEIKRYPKETLTFSYRHSSFHEKEGMIVAATFLLNPDVLANERKRALVEYRVKTQPYKDPSVGCIFRNPSGGSAGALIDKCLLKGTRLGEAEVSTMHANFIVNRGKASQGDVLNLAKRVQNEVELQTGIKLQLEARFIDVEGRLIHGL